MTLTCGDLTYSPSTFSMSRASCVGVLPTATISSTNGVEILPSGRTGTLEDSSALRQTNTCRLSPGPMMYAGATGAVTELVWVFVLRLVFAVAVRGGAACCTGADDVQPTAPKPINDDNIKEIQVLRDFTGARPSACLLYTSP